MQTESYENFKSRYDEISNAYRDGSLTRENLQLWHLTQLRTVINHVKNNSKFYSKHLAHISADSVNLENLASLPFTTKDDLRTQMHDMMSGPLNDALYYYETTGTTGAATPCPRDKKESYASNRQLCFAYKDVFDNIFGSNHKPILGVLGPTEVHSFSDTLGSIANDIGICHAKIWPGSPVIGFDKCLSLIRDLKIEVIATSPGQVMTLAKEAKKRGLDPAKDFSVKAFMLSGELCTDSLTKNLESLWGARAFNSLYGSQEAFVIASTTKSNKLRPHLPNYIFELVDPESGEYQGFCGKGELVVTCLVDGIKPLIRYRTGDIVEINDTGFSTLFDAYEISVVGRVRDSLQLNNKSFTAAEIETSLLADVSNCLGYQIVISNANGSDSIIAKLEIPNLPSDICKSTIKHIGQRIESQLGCQNSVLIVDDLSDHVNLGGWIKWKAARLIDTRISEPNSQVDLSPDQLMSRLNS